MMSPINTRKLTPRRGILLSELRLAFILSVNIGRNNDLWKLTTSRFTHSVHSPMIPLLVDQLLFQHNVEFLYEGLVCVGASGMLWDYQVLILVENTHFGSF